MMRVARRAGLDQQVALASQAGFHQVMVDRTGHEQRMRGQLSLDQVAVRKKQHQLAVANGALRLLAHPQNRGFQPLGGLVLQVDELVRDFLQPQDLPQLALRQNRRAQHDLARMLGRRHEDVALRSDLGLQRHDDGLAQRIDRRVRHLGELLSEVIVERADLVRQNGHRRVVAH